MFFSESLHNQILRVGKIKSFFMTSYVVYAAARRGIFPTLNAVGVLGEALGQKKVWDHYDQLTLQTSELHYRRVNDAFLYVIINRLIGDARYRLSRESIAFITE